MRRVVGAHSAAQHVTAMGSNLSPDGPFVTEKARTINDLRVWHPRCFVRDEPMAMDYARSIPRGARIMNCGRRHSTAVSGFTLVELLVVIALLVIVGAISAPFYLSYQRAQETNGAARELIVSLNQARQLAITRSTSFSVESQGNPQNRLRLCAGTVTPCPGGSVWLGPGTDGAGWTVLDNGARITQNPRVTFNSLGAATATGTLRVQNSSGTGCLDAVVSPSGRIQLTAAAACP
jgi:prepilin-type N-terminal cleavage/methylation domain-containing protein